eukprot:12901230-Prorocentrum_lima.AAC.1
MHEDIQEDQECQRPHSRFDRHSPKPLQAAHLLFKVPMATTSLVPRMQKQLGSSVLQKKRQPG